MCRPNPKFTPSDYEENAPLIIDDVSGVAWRPVLDNPCAFNPDVFLQVMLNLIRHPNIHSSLLFRADILFDEPLDTRLMSEASRSSTFLPTFNDFTGDRILVRRLIPRNTNKDKPLVQTCAIYRRTKSPKIKQTLVVYVPHLTSKEEVPFYHPDVRGIAFLHEWDEEVELGSVSLHLRYFEGLPRSERVSRIAFQLLAVVHKHGEGVANGYVKKSVHDTLVPQKVVQDRYAALKQKYAGELVKGWAEVTDPVKHVFEDLSIAAFLIELWSDMYRDQPFPGFVDIGCGNGLLSYILHMEGYAGYGFDARVRKSWAGYNRPMRRGADTSPESEELLLRQMVLLPSMVDHTCTAPDAGSETSCGIHSGEFPLGTFIISNHADELTPWTPLLAAQSRSPFISIPCCSHALNGSRFRAPPPKDKTQTGNSASSSTYASLVAWVTELARDCGWEVEQEKLRIPSTRDIAIIGRKMSKTLTPEELEEVLVKYGGAEGYADNVMKLVKKSKDH